MSNLAYKIGKKVDSHPILAGIIAIFCILLAINVGLGVLAPILFLLGVFIIRIL